MSRRRTGSSSETQNKPVGVKIKGKSENTPATLANTKVLK